MTVLLCLYTKALCSIKGNEKYLQGFAQSASLAENAWRCGIITVAKIQSINELCRLMWMSYIYLKEWNADQILASSEEFTQGPRLWFWLTYSSSTNYTTATGVSKMLHKTVVLSARSLLSNWTGKTKAHREIIGNASGGIPNELLKWSKFKGKCLSSLATRSAQCVFIYLYLCIIFIYMCDAYFYIFFPNILN